MSGARKPQDLTPMLTEAVREQSWWCYWKHPHGSAVAGIGDQARVDAADWDQLPDDSRGFLCAAFDGISSEAWGGFGELQLVVPDDVFVGELPKKPAEPGDRFNAEGTYADHVRSALRSIEAGLVDKVVIAREEVVPAADAVATLTALQHAFPSCYVFAVSDGENVFLGATPERLIEVRDGRVDTTALAGTSAPGDDSLLRSDKDLREHRWVVDGIETALQPHCRSLDIPGEPELLKLPNVQHLHTPITGVLRDGRDWRHAAGALHPTPAVCGEPREKAKQLIREIEGFDRGLYAGVVGWVHHRNAELAVALRSALLEESQTRLYAGAGIVAGSDPDAEDAETVSKLQAVARLLRYR